MVLIGPINWKITLLVSPHLSIFLFLVDSCAFEPLVKSSTDHAIGIANAWSMYLLLFFARMFIAKRWIVVSKFECSSVDKNLLFLN